MRQKTIVLMLVAVMIASCMVIPSASYAQTDENSIQEEVNIEEDYIQNTPYDGEESFKEISNEFNYLKNNLSSIVSQIEENNIDIVSENSLGYLNEILLHLEFILEDVNNTEDKNQEKAEKLNSNIIILKERISQLEILVNDEYSQDDREIKKIIDEIKNVSESVEEMIITSKEPTEDPEEKQNIEDEDKNGQEEEKETPEQKVEPMTIHMEPKNLLAKVEGSNIKLSWDKVDGVDSYKVLFSTDKKNWSLKTTVKTNYYLFSNPNTKQRIYFKIENNVDDHVVIANAGREVSNTTVVKESNVVSIFTAALGATNFKVSPIDYKTARLTWSDVRGIDSYKVYYSKDKKVWTYKGTAKDNAYTVSSLTTAQTYYYKVISNTDSTTLKDNGLSDVTAVQILRETGVVSAKTQLKKTSVKGVMKSVKAGTISWKKVEGAHGYYIYRYDAKTKKYKAYKRIDGGTKVTSKIGLKAGSNNYFKVSAYRTNSNKRVATTAISEHKKFSVPKVLKRSTPGFSSTNAGKLIATAKTKVGKAYISGASGPNAFDCSGFAWWTYKKSNVSSKKFSRSTAQGEYNQMKKYNIGKNLKNAQPGDIIYFSNGGSKTGIYHVALYYGNDQLIHATNPRTDVAITSVGDFRRGNIAAIVRLPEM